MINKPPLMKSYILKTMKEKYKVIALFLIGGIGVHALIMLLDYYLIPEPLYLNLRNNFIGSIFSAHMIPMILVYGISLVVINALWAKSKKAWQLVHQKEAQKETVKYSLKAMQRLTGVLADNIAIHNSEIMGWVQSQKIRGKQVSKKVESPNQKIAKSLHILSEISFIYPYTDAQFTNIVDFEKLIHKKLNEIDKSTNVNSELLSMSQKKYLNGKIIDIDNSSIGLF